MAFAEKADKEGYSQAARLFRAAAEAETVHAINHLKALGAIKSTKENLREAIAGETQEFKEMYPEMIKAAKAEGKDDESAIKQARVSVGVKPAKIKAMIEVDDPAKDKKALEKMGLEVGRVIKRIGLIEVEGTVDELEAASELGEVKMIRENKRVMGF